MSEEWPASAASGSGTTRKAQRDQSHAQQVLHEVADLRFDRISSAIAQAQAEVQEQLADVSAKLAVHLDTLGNVEEAIRLKMEQLRELQQIEVASNTLDDL